MLFVMPEPGDYEVKEVRGHSEYIVSNEKINMSMKIIPGYLYKDGHIVRDRNVAEVWFAFSAKPKEVAEENWNWPYLITQKDLGFINVSDSDYISEVFDKYLKKFQSMTERPSTGINDRFSSYEKFTNQIFPDIEEKRKVENRRG